MKAVRTIVTFYNVNNQYVLKNTPVWAVVFTIKNRNTRNPIRNHFKVLLPNNFSVLTD